MAKLIDVPVSMDLLSRVAADFSGSDFGPGSNEMFVFNNNRAIHAFIRRWAERRGGPSFSPPICTLEGLLALAAGSPDEGCIEEPDAVLLLHRAVSAMRRSPLPKELRELSAFYPWGAEWVRAFSELDAEMVPDNSLRGIENIEELSGATQGTRDFYRALPEIRAAFRQEVQKSGLLTRGELYSLSRENILSGKWTVPERIIFIGIFALAKGEMELMKLLDSRSDITFYRHHDGGEWSPFLELEKELHLAGDIVEKAAIPEMKLHALPSVHAEALRTGEILSQAKGDLSDTAVVLLKPDPLMPILWEVATGLDREINITMGYPLSRTPLFSLLQSLLAACDGKKGDRYMGANYLDLLSHPYIKNLALPLGESGERADPSHTRILVHCVEKSIKDRNWATLDLRELGRQAEIFSRARNLTGDDLSEERAKQLLLAINDLLVIQPGRAGSLGELSRSLRAVVDAVASHSPARKHRLFSPFCACAEECLLELENLLVSGEKMVDCEMVRKIALGQLSGATVPFTGLPMRGLQVLGLLETRALSFKRVIILDCNADALPPVKEADPVLPPTIRRRLGLTGYTERVEVSRYNFKRLLLSSQEVHLLYVDGEDSPRSPLLEELAFQLQMERGMKGAPAPQRMAFKLGPSDSDDLVVIKSAELSEKLAAMTYSPTDLDSYLDCPLKFYFQKVCKLSEATEISEEIDARAVGSLLHQVLGELFEPYMGSILDEGAFSQMISDLPAVLDKTFPPQGEAALLKGLARDRITTFLAKEKVDLAGQIEVLRVENRLEASIQCGGRAVKITGKLDRMDRLGDSILITDYKSGKKPLKSQGAELEEWKSPPTRESVKKRISSFQLPLYIELAKAEMRRPYGDINARFVYLREPGATPARLFEDPGQAEAWMEKVLHPALDAIIGEILNPAIPFAPVPQKKACDYCPFVVPCGYNFSRGGLAAEEE